MWQASADAAPGGTTLGLHFGTTWLAKKVQCTTPALCNQALNEIPSACLRNTTGKLPLFRAKLVGSRAGVRPLAAQTSPFP